MKKIFKKYSLISKILIIIFILFLLLMDRIKFYPSWVDYIFFNIFFSIPSIVLIIAFLDAISKKKINRANFISIPLIPVLFITVFIWIFRLLASYEEIQRLHLENTDLVVYLENCGATCPYLLDVRQEQKIIPGIYWSTFIDNSNPNFDLRFEVIGKNKVRAISTYDDYPNPEEDFSFQKDYDLGHIMPGQELTLSSRIFP